jgi:hypothetical protein
MERQTSSIFKRVFLVARLRRRCIPTRCSRSDDSFRCEATSHSHRASPRVRRSDSRGSAGFVQSGGMIHRNRTVSRPLSSIEDDSAPPASLASPVLNHLRIRESSFLKNGIPTRVTDSVSSGATPRSGQKQHETFCDQFNWSQPATESAGSIHEVRGGRPGDQCSNPEAWESRREGTCGRTSGGSRGQSWPANVRILSGNTNAPRRWIQSPHSPKARPGHACQGLRCSSSMTNGQLQSCSVNCSR